LHDIATIACDRVLPPGVTAIVAALQQWKGHSITTARNSSSGAFRIASAAPADVPLILAMIRGLADYERLSQICVATEADIREALFGEKPFVEVVLVWEGRVAAGFALFFHNFSTFLGRPGLYLEDLYVRPEYRRRGYGRALLLHLAGLAVERRCGRFEWSVLDWNAPAIGFYESIGATILPDWRIARVTGAALEKMARLPSGASSTAD
jgi:GNAT superfamily N-acetyltransferase